MWIEIKGHFVNLDNVSLISLGRPNIETRGNEVEVTIPHIAFDNQVITFSNGEELSAAWDKVTKAIRT